MKFSNSIIVIALATLLIVSCKNNNSKSDETATKSDAKKK
jgi:outer membrane lipoprotein SlyB